MPEKLRRSPFILLGNIDPDLQYQVLEPDERAELALVDTMNYWIEGKRDPLLHVLERCDVILLNDPEARMLCDTVQPPDGGARDARDGSQAHDHQEGRAWLPDVLPRRLLQRAGVPAGEDQGSYGAGDTFAGGFIGSLAGAPRLNEAAYRKAVVIGTAMASFTVEDF